MSDLADLLLAFAVFLAPLGLAWWLLRDKSKRPRRGGSQRRREGDAPHRPSGRASE